MAKGGRNSDFIESLIKKGWILDGKGGYTPPSKSNLLADNIVPKRNIITVHQTQTVGETTLHGAAPLIVFEVDPIGAPRMTRSDQWKTNPDHDDPKKRQRKPVQQYFKFKDSIRSQAAERQFILPDSFHAVCVIPMPHSWSDKKKGQMDGARHQQKPDFDNCAKAICDSLLDNDAVVWDCRITKYWGRSGKIVIYKL